MLQDPLSGKGIFGYGTLTNEEKLALKLGVVVDMTGAYAVNNNGKQLAVTAVVVVAEENLSKVEAIAINSLAELDVIKASTDVNLHSRLVKFVGVKIVSANTDKKSFVITFGGEDSQYIAVGFMDSANAEHKSRDDINALALQLLAAGTVFDLYAVQNAGNNSGLVWNFGTPTLDYFVVPVA